MKRLFLTSMMIFLWSFTWFIPIFTKYSNCWYWAVWQRITKGGQIIPLASKRWGGHHWIWQDKDGVKWEYTRKDLPEYSFWYQLYVYKGYARKFRAIGK